MLIYDARAQEQEEAEKKQRARRAAEKAEAQRRERLTGNALLLKELSEDSSTIIRLNVIQVNDYQIQYSVSMSQGALGLSIVYKPDTRIKTDFFFMFA
jgi:hypothetical protein